MPASEALIQMGLLGEAIDHGPVAVLVADENMRYIAVNQFACDMLGYTREELLELRVTDVAQYEEAPAQYTEMIVAGFQEGTTRLVAKDGSLVEARYRAGETTVAGMQLYVAVNWPLAAPG